MTRTYKKNIIRRGLNVNVAGALSYVPAPVISNVRGILVERTRRDFPSFRIRTPIVKVKVALIAVMHLRR